MMNINASKEIKQNKRLLTKKDFLNIAINDPDLNIDELKKMKVNELRELYKITHLIDGNLRDMRGYCFSCLTALKPDYTRFENYCLDC